MPTPRPALFKNATGRLQESAANTRHCLPLRFRSPISAHPLQSQSAPPKGTRGLHQGPRVVKQRQISQEQPLTPQVANPPSKEFLADLTASAWSTSIINTGYPVSFNEFPSFPPPQTNEPIDVTPILQPAFDISNTFWNFSPINTGAWISGDSFFALQYRYNLPPRSLEAYDNIMASDEDYAAFLDKADSDRQAAPAAQQKITTQQKTVNTQQLHPALQSVHEHTYTSDADEPFEAVSLTRASGKSGSVNKSEVAQLAGVSEDRVEELSKKDFDPRSDYETVWKQVAEASNGGVKAFKVEREGARSEYWLLGVSKDGHVVGARATAVES